MGGGNHISYNFSTIFCSEKQLAVLWGKFQKYEIIMENEGKNCKSSDD